jgi:hypothetical protein
MLQGSIPKMVKLHVLKPDDIEDAPLDPDSYAGRLMRSITELRAFLNDPVALMGRAAQLLEGTADPVGA